MVNQVLEPFAFNILEGGDIDDFECVLRSIVEEAPLLLAEMRLKMESKGFSWEGKPKSAINNLKTISVVQDYHPQPVDFVVLKERERDCAYLGRNPKFMLEGAVLPRERTSKKERSSYIKQNYFDKNLFFNQVFLPNPVLKKLKEIAQDEDWTTDANYVDGVLWNYLKLTYARLEQQGKIFEGNGCRLFNTGLFDKNYEAIYAYMEPNIKQSRQPWCCRRFAGRDDAVMRKNLPEVLERASWFDKFDDLFFDASKEVFPNYDHCMLENADRLPRGIFEKILNKEDYQMTLRFFDSLNRVNENNADDIRCLADEYGMIFDTRKSLSNHTQKQKLTRFFFERMSNFEHIKANLYRELDYAISRAKKIVASDYAAAVPTFYPEDNSFALMLPLSFNYNYASKNDCALVVVRNKNGEKEEKTLLSIGMAYTNARLLRRPDAHWMMQCIDGTRLRSAIGSGNLEGEPQSSEGELEHGDDNALEQCENERW